MGTPNVSVLLTYRKAGFYLHSNNLYTLKKLQRNLCSATLDRGKCTPDDVGFAFAGSAVCERKSPRATRRADHKQGVGVLGSGRMYCRHAERTDWKTAARIREKKLESLSYLSRLPKSSLKVPSGCSGRKIGSVPTCRGMHIRKHQE